MIEKLKTLEDDEIDISVGAVNTRFADTELVRKINELVDTVNTIQKEREAERFEIQEWIAILEAVRESVNIHEKQIDELQMKLRPIIEERESGIKVYEETMEMVKRNDPYAEQRKWIGKICRFWNDDESLEDSTYGELVNIFDAPHEDCPFQCGYGEWYEHCEPVKPDDDIIYKGVTND